MGSLFRQIDETSVDVEELFHMLNTKPRVKEKDDAKDFEWKEGKIEINNLGFKHYDYDQKVKNSDGETKKQVI